MHSKPPENNEIQMFKHRAVESARNKPNADWRDEVKISEDYTAHRAVLLNMLSDLQDMRDSHLGRMKETRHGIELKTKDTRCIHSAPYRHGPKVREF